MERRRTRRNPCDLLVTWRRGKRTVVARAADVNADGLFLQTAEPFDLNQVMDLVVLLPDGAIQFLAVSRHREAEGIGVSIHAMDSEEKARWRGYCRGLGGSRASGAPTAERSAREDARLSPAPARRHPPAQASPDRASGSPPPAPGAP